jgi:hypothetical protein
VDDEHRKKLYGQPENPESPRLRRDQVLGGPDAAPPASPDTTAPDAMRSRADQAMASNQEQLVAGALDNLADQIRHVADALRNPDLPQAHSGTRQAGPCDPRSIVDLVGGWPGRGPAGRVRLSGLSGAGGTALSYARAFADNGHQSGLQAGFSMTSQAILTEVLTDLVR